MKFGTIAATAALALTAPAAAQTAAQVTLYELPGYLGRSVTVTAATTDLAHSSSPPVRRVPD